MEDLVPVTRFYSIYHVVNNEIVSHKEHPYHSGLDQTLKAIYMDSSYKKFPTFKLTNMVGKLHEIDIQSFKQNVMEKDTYRNISFENYVVPYKGAYILIVYHRTTPQNAITLVKQSGYCKKCILQYHVLNGEIVDKRLLKPMDNLKSKILEPALGLRVKQMSMYMRKKNRITGEYKLNFVNMTEQTISAVYRNETLEEDFLQNLEENNDVILEDFIVPYRGVYVIFSYYETTKTIATNLVMQDIDSKETIKFYMRVPKAFYPYPVVRLNMRWPINELLEHQLVEYTGQQEFADFVINGSDALTLSKDMDKTEFVNALEKSMPFLEFQWNVTDEMKELVWKASQNESFWNQYESMRRVFDEYFSFIPYGNIERLYNVSMLRHRQLPNHPVVMMITATSRKRIHKAYTQMFIVRPPTYWLWSIMHPETPRLSKISLLMHSVTMYSMDYIYREVDTLMKTAESAYIPRPYRRMEEILKKANELGLIDYGRGRGILITYKSMLFWTHWYNVNYYNTGIQQQCVSCGLNATYQCPCKGAFYCGLPCQIEHWIEEHCDKHIGITNKRMAQIFSSLNIE